MPTGSHVSYEPLPASSSENNLLPPATGLRPDEEINPENLTTKRELFGWYLCSWASEPFIVSAVGTYVPLLLEQFARENGFRLNDPSVPCLQPPSHRPPPGDIGGDPAAPPPGTGGGPSPDLECVVNVLGYQVDTSSFALYTFSLSVLVQTVVVISMSGAADRGTFRRPLLVAFGLFGALITMLFLSIDSDHYYLASLFAVVSNASYGAVSVCANSYLPILTARHATVLSAQQQLAEDSDYSFRQYLFDVNSLTARISGLGASLGYLAALIVQVSTIYLVVRSGQQTVSIQLAVFVVGLWWLIFQIPLPWLLPSGDGGLAGGSAGGSAGGRRHRRSRWWLSRAAGSTKKYVAYGWKALGAAFHQARNMRDVGIFLLGWFIVSDAFTTINSAAVLFARTQLQMSTPSLAFVGVLVVFSGILGSLVTPRVVLPYLRLGPVGGLLFVVLWAAVVPLYGVLGFYTDALGLRKPWEMYLLAVWYGVAMGSLNTLARSVFSLLIPKGKESTFFSLFSVTDKGSSILGPLVTGLITDRTHNIRYCFFFLLFVLLLGVPVFLLLDVERGREEARALEAIDPDDQEED